MVFESFQHLMELSQGAFSKENTTFEKKLPNIGDLGTTKRVPK